MKFAKFSASIASTIALVAGAFVGVSVAPANAAGGTLTASVADSSAKTSWPSGAYNAGGKLVYRGQAPGSGNNTLLYLDGTESKPVDMSSIPNFSNFSGIIGEFDGDVFISVYLSTDVYETYSYNGSTFTVIPELDEENNDFQDGVEWNSAWYFRASARQGSGWASGRDALYKIQNNVMSIVNFGDENNPVLITHAEPRASFNGKLYVDGWLDGDQDRYLLEVTENGVSKVTATLDYYGTPTLRSFAYVSNAYVFNNYLFFGAMRYADGLQDAYWNGGNGDRAAFRMDTAGNVVRLEPTANDPFTGGMDLTSVVEGFTPLGQTLFFQSCIMGTNACSLYKIVGDNVTFVRAIQGLDLQWNSAVANGKLYIGNTGEYVGTIADSSNQVSEPQLGYLNEDGNYTKLTGGQNYSYWNAGYAYNNGLIFIKPDADPRTKDELWFTNGTTEYKLGGFYNPDFDYVKVTSGGLYIYAFDPNDADGTVGRLVLIKAGSQAAAPGPVTGLRTSVSNGKINLTWTAPGSADATGYTVTSTPAGATCVVTGTTAVCSGTAGVSYTFTVKATNNGGDSAAVTSVATVIPVNTDNPDLGSLTETKTVTGTKGSITFPDGSGLDVDSKGRIYSKFKSKYLVTVTGTIKVTYKVGKATKTYTCTLKPYGSKVKLKKVPTAAILYKAKTPCQLPAAALSYMKIGKITIVQKATMTRLYPTTALPKDKATGKAIRKLVRNMTVKLGK